MPLEKLVVALGDRRYVVERPWGALPDGVGKVTDVAAAPGGRVVVLTRRDHYVDPPADCVHVLSPDGEAIGSWGASRIADAHKIACDPQGRVWVTDRDSHEVVAFDPKGREIMALGRRHGPGDPFNHPTDVAFGADGTIWISEGYAGHRVFAFRPGGTLSHAWGRLGKAEGELINPHGLWVTPDGRVVVADRENDRVQAFDTEGRLLAVWTSFHRPSDIWGDAEGRLYVSDGIPSLSLLAPDGRRLGRSRPVLNGAHGLSGDSQGHIYLAEGNPSRVTRLAPLD